MRVLVTGAAGFTGTRMMEFLSGQQGVTSTGLIRNKPTKNAGDIGKQPVITADLLDRDSLFSGIAEVSPDAVVHLAGLTHGTFDALHSANVTGTKNMLDAVLAVNPDCRILVVSSSAVYGYAGDSPIPETAPLQPVSDYGKSKMAQEERALGYLAQGAAVAVARPFNLAGPGQTDAFVCGRIVKQVVEIERGERAALELREIVSARDLIDVRDVVRGYWALISHPDFSGDCAGRAFNIGSGNAYPLSTVIALAGEITGRHFDVHLPETQPPVPVPTQRSDNTRIISLTGWKPEISLKETLKDMIDTERGMSANP
jgi:GDP-4-dehydro-6-deoxy-D-mannose reductase